MVMQRLYPLCLIIFLLTQACTGSDNKQSEVSFKQLPELQEIKPQKPVKIKLKRNTKGNYSWELSGDNVDEVVKVDRRLREYLKTETLNSKH
jgi:thioredoxin-related protein